MSLIYFKFVVEIDKKIILKSWSNFYFNKYMDEKLDHIKLIIFNYYIQYFLYISFLYFKN